MTSCAFCEVDSEDIQSRVIRKGQWSCSLVPKHHFRGGHVLVIPLRHVTEIGELTSDESVEMMSEVGRLARRVDSGFGSGVMQKYQPLQHENGIKMNHIHFHVFPRTEDEVVLFPVPEPNSFEGLEIVNDVAKIAEGLR